MIAIWVGIGIALDNVRLLSENVIHGLREHGKFWDESASNIAPVLKLVQPLAQMGAMMVSSVVDLFRTEARA